MATTKTLRTVTLTMEVENGVDSKGATAFKKKNYSGVKPSATPEDIYAVAAAIKSVLSVGTRFFYVTENSDLTQA